MAKCIMCDKCGKLTLDVSAITGQKTKFCKKCFSQTTEYKDLQAEKVQETYNKHLNKAYNITIEDYNRKFNHQKGKCAICGKHQKDLGYRLSVDHNHDTGQIRALLCQGCNRIVGLVENKQPTIDEVKKYLTKYD